MSDQSHEFRAQLEERIRRYAALRDDIQAQLLELNHSLNTTERRLQTAVEMFRLEFGELPESVGGLAEPPLARVEPRVQRQTDGPSWNEAVIATLTEAREPLHLTELWRRLVASGFKSAAKDPLRALAAVVVRHPDVHRTGPNTYGLASMPGAQASLEELAADSEQEQPHEGEAA